MRTIFLFLTAFFGIIIPACSTLDEVVTDPIDGNNPYVSSMYHSDCYDLNNGDYWGDSVGENSRSWEAPQSYLEMTIRNGVAKCAIRQWMHCCTWGKLNMKTRRSDSIVTLVMEEVMGDGPLATCLCYFDVYFTLENLPEEDFILEILKIKDVDLDKDRKPQFRELVEVKDSTHRWECFFPYYL